MPPHQPLEKHMQKAERKKKNTHKRSKLGTRLIRMRKKQRERKEMHHNT
jgi:hypothetical protein